MQCLTYELNPTNGREEEEGAWGSEKGSCSGTSSL